MTKKKNNSSKTNSTIRPTNQNKRPKPRPRRSKGANALGYVSNPNTISVVQPPGVSNAKVSRAKPYKLMQSLPRASQAGMAFLKCAFAPPDFASSDVRGVPDSFQGKSLVKKHRFIGNITFARGFDYYILLLPVPGYSYFFFSLPANTPVVASTVLNGVTYSDYQNLFNAAGTGSGNTADVVNRFRYVSNHVEIIPTTNSMSWTGNFQVFRVPIQFAPRPSTVAINQYTVSGLNGLNATNADQYTGPFNLGAYAAAYNTGNGFDFSSIVEGLVTVPTTVIAGDFGTISTTFGFTGFDNNFDCVCVKLSGVGDNPLDTCIIKTWACVEYLAVLGSSVYEYQTFSMSDPVALDMYRKIIRELPVGVSYLDNEGFWTRVLSIIKRMSGAAAVLPGPYGLAAAGVNMTASALESLVL